jgi:hypothetical protein
VHADAVVQARVDARSGLVDVPPAEGHEPHGEVAHLTVVEVDRGVRGGSRAPVDPD